MKLRKKLIEVALPLEAINKASALEKGNPFLKGHPRSLHQWWARRPLAAARAVIFSQMVDDPLEYVDTLKSDPKVLKRAEIELKKRHKVWEAATAELARAEAAGISAPPPGPEPTLDEIIAEQERDRLFKIIEELVLWENTTNETVLEKARAEIWQCWRRTCADNADHPHAKELFDRNKLPAFHDPFAGGGALPLEAQRLGFEAHASDLNPVAVLINKAMIEIPPKFAGMPPVNPDWQSKSDAEKMLRDWKGAEGLADDIRYYSKSMRNQAERRIGHLFPKVKITAEMAKERPDLKPLVGREFAPTTWIWARTVKSPNPAFSGIDVPLASTFILCNAKGKEAFIDPIIEDGGYTFNIQLGKSNGWNDAKTGTKLSRGANFSCLMSNVPIQPDFIKAEGRAGRMGSRLMAIVIEGTRERIYLPPTEDAERSALSVSPEWSPDTPLGQDPRALWTPPYGLTKFGDLFSSRQLIALSTHADLIGDIHESVIRDAANANREKARDEKEYADSIVTFLALAVDKMADYNNSLCTWNPTNQNIGHLFTKQAIPMAWDYPEVSPFAGGLSIEAIADGIARAVLSLPASHHGTAFQHDCCRALGFDKLLVVSTDPPYYDNIGYADLSDFFYVWLRRSLRSIYPDLLSTLAVPKTDELIASPYRHEGKESAEEFFLSGMTRAMQRIAVQAHPDVPITIYYAFKQSESRGETDNTSTGWETFLEAVIESGLALTGTWPIRTERQARSVGIGTNALASSIVLVCRKRTDDAPTATRREYVNALKAELPEALRHLQRGNIAPVDLAQAAIGPGMSVYTRYEKVLDAEGKRLSVRDALALINQTLDEVLAEQEGDFDADTRWALTWFDEMGFDEGEYGRAEQLSKAKNTSIAEMADPRTSPILEAKAGKVRLFRPEELESDWTPETDGRLTVWDMVHHLIRVLEKDGEAPAARIVAKLGAKAETARELCYRLYTLCERKKRASEALSYNGLVQSWPEIMRLARETSGSEATQTELFG